MLNPKVGDILWRKAGHKGRYIYKVIIWEMTPYQRTFFGQHNFVCEQGNTGNVLALRYLGDYSKDKQPIIYKDVMALPFTNSILSRLTPVPKKVLLEFSLYMVAHEDK